MDRSIGETAVSSRWKVDGELGDMVEGFSIAVGREKMSQYRGIRSTPARLVDRQNDTNELIDPGPLGPWPLGRLFVLP